MLKDQVLLDKPKGASYHPIREGVSDNPIRNMNPIRRASLALFKVLGASHEFDCLAVRLEVEINENGGFDAG